MKKLLLTAAFIAGVCGVLAVPAFAGSADDPVVQRRERRQDRRIEQGKRSGQIAPREAAKLEAEQNKIKRDDQNAKADGKVTPKERRKLRREQNRAGRDIYREKHDRQTL